MPITFDKDWSQEVADESTKPVYQNCEIAIINPDLIVRTGTITSGYTYDRTAATIWLGQARVASMRSGLGAGGTTSTNPTRIKSIRVQIPYEKDFPRLLRGWQVQVIEGGRNDRLMDYLFAIESDINSSHVASVTFECTTDVESAPNWAGTAPAPPVFGGYGYGGYGD